MDRLELVGVQTEQLEDCWGDLRRLYRICDVCATDRSGPFDQDGDVSVLEVITAMFGDLFRPTGVDDPVLRDSDHIGYSGIALIDAYEPRRSGTCVDLRKTGRREGYVVNTGHRSHRIVVFQEEIAREVGGRFGPVVQPEKH